MEFTASLSITAVAIISTCDLGIHEKYTQLKKAVFVQQPKYHLYRFLTLSFQLPIFPVKSPGTRGGRKAK